MAKKFGELIEEHGLSGKALSEKAGLDYNTVWRLTSGTSDQTNIRISTFVKIANALDEPIADLADELGVEDVYIPDNQNLNAEQRELARIYKRLEPERQAALLEVARALRLRSSFEALQGVGEEEIEGTEEDAEDIEE